MTMNDCRELGVDFFDMYSGYIYHFSQMESNVCPVSQDGEIIGHFDFTKKVLFKY